MSFALTFPFPLGGDEPTHGGFERITDYCQDALDLLISEYQGRPRIEAWICSFMDRAQEIENVIWDMWLAWSIASTGDQLDLIGRVVGEARNGRVDATYRRYIRTRILVNRSQGRAEELIKIARLFEDLGDASGLVKLQGVGPAALEVRVYPTPTSVRGDLHRRLNAAREAGARLQSLRHPGGASGSFRLCRAADYPEGSTTEGFALADGSVQGGKLADVLD